jgi:hypothetical protein
MGLSKSVKTAGFVITGSTSLFQPPYALFASTEREVSQTHMVEIKSVIGLGFHNSRRESEVSFAFVPIRLATQSVPMMDNKKI